MREIESSNRLYEEEGAVYLTSTIVTKLDTDLPQHSQITFILKNGCLITNRYTDPLPFRRYISYAERHAATCNSGPAVLAGLVEAIINRVADVVERVSADLDAISAEVFTRPSGRRRGGARDFRAVLERVGQSGELIAKTRESLVSLGRALAFVQQAATANLTNEVRTRLRTLSRDVVALSGLRHEFRADPLAARILGLHGSAGADGGFRRDSVRHLQAAGMAVADGPRPRRSGGTPGQRRAVAAGAGFG